MGWVFAMGPCIGCGKVFSFNPHLVPSTRRTPTSPKEPICFDCVNRYNPIRIKNGLEPIIPVPGAYEEMPEELL